MTFSLCNECLLGHVVTCLEKLSINQLLLYFSVMSMFSRIGTDHSTCKQHIQVSYTIPVLKMLHFLLSVSENLFAGLVISTLSV